LAIVAGAAFWVFYDAARRDVEPTLWKAFTVAAVVLVLPSLVLWAMPARASGRLVDLFMPLAYVGLGAAAVALLSLLLYIAGVGVRPWVRYCPDCGQPQHASWPYCLYCAERQAQEVATSVSPPAPPPAPPTEYVEPVVASEHRAVSAGMRRTEILRPADTGALAWLVLLSGTRAGKEFRLGETTTIGRDPALNDIILDDGAVSRQHAKVKFGEDGFTLHDLASTRGTFVRDHDAGAWVQVHKHRLADGDHIKLGREVLAFMQVVRADT
jgi:hypothetical protein